MSCRKTYPNSLEGGTSVGPWSKTDGSRQDALELAVRAPDDGRPSVRFHTNPRLAAGAVGRAIAVFQRLNTLVL
jgi:hypothetical protein